MIKKIPKNFRCCFVLVECIQIEEISGSGTVSSAHICFFFSRKMHEEDQTGGSAFRSNDLGEIKRETI